MGADHALLVGELRVVAVLQAVGDDLRLNLTESFEEEAFDLGALVENVARQTLHLVHLARLEVDGALQLADLHRRRLVLDLTLAHHRLSLRLELTNHVTQGRLQNIDFLAKLHTSSVNLTH